MERTRHSRNGIDGDASSRSRADLVTPLAQTLHVVADALPAVLASGASDVALLAAEVDVVLTLVARCARTHNLDPGLRAAADALAHSRAAASRTLPAPGRTAATDTSEGSVPVDLLAAERAHVVLFFRMLTDVTDAGRSLGWLPAPVPKVLADAEAVLGDAVIGHDHELAARVLATWPLLGAPWTAPTRCALDRLLAAQAASGHLPATNGPVSASGHDRLLAAARPSIALASVLALALEHGPVPQPWTPSAVDLVIGEQLAPGGPSVDATLLVSAAVLRAADHARLRAILDLAACGVAADSALAAALDELAGPGPFAARAA